MRVEPEILRGEGVRLEPLQLDHANGLYNRARSGAEQVRLLQIRRDLPLRATLHR